MYDTGEYAYSRLGGTIVRLAKGGKPITIHGCNDTGRRGSKIIINYNFLSNGRRGEDVYLTELDLTPVPLGWADHSMRDAAYLVRIPKRSDYRQGLRLSNYMSLWGANNRMITAQSLSRTILGKYMNFENALDEAANHGKVTAFSRHFAVRPQGRTDNMALYFKWYGVVGDVVNGLPELDNRFDHLQEALEGAL